MATVHEDGGAVNDTWYPEPQLGCPRRLFLLICRSSQAGRDAIRNVHTLVGARMSIDAAPVDVPTCFVNLL